MELAEVRRVHFWTVAAALLAALLWAHAARAVEAPGPGPAAAEPTEFAVIEEAQAMLAEGRNAEAAKFLGERIEKYPESDLLHYLHGRAFMLSGKVREAGKSFRKALELNPNSDAAKRCLEEVNRTVKLVEGEVKQKTYEKVLSYVNDKVLYVVFGAAAAVYSLFFRTIMLASKRRKFARSLRDKEYHELTDALTYMLKHSRKAQLRLSLAKMQEVLSPEEIEKIIIDYVDDQKVEDDLLYMYRKMAQRPQ